MILKRKISSKTKILPRLIPLIIPDFEKHSDLSTPLVLSINNLDSKIWFKEFINLLESRIAKEYFPIMRLSEGEYQFFLGAQLPLFSGSKIQYTRSLFRFILDKINYKKKLVLLLFLVFLQEIMIKMKF